MLPVGQGVTFTSLTGLLHVLAAVGMGQAGRVCLVLVPFSASGIRVRDLPLGSLQPDLVCGSRGSTTTVGRLLPQVKLVSYRRLPPGPRLPSS